MRARQSLLLVLVIGQLLCHFVCALIHNPDSLRACPSLLVVLIGQLLCVLCARLSVDSLCVRLSITLCTSPCTFKRPELPRTHEIKFIATPRIEEQIYVDLGCCLLNRPTTLCVRLVCFLLYQCRLKWTKTAWSLALALLWLFRNVCSLLLESFPARAATFAIFCVKSTDK